MDVAALERALAEALAGAGPLPLPALPAAGAEVAIVLARPGFQVRGASDDLLPLVRAVLDEHPGPVSQYLGGKTSTLGFLVGQVMKKSGGQAVAQNVRELLMRELGQPAER